MTFWLTIIFSVLHFLDCPQKTVKRKSPAVLKIYIQTALEIYGFLGSALLFSFAVQYFLPAVSDLTGMVLFLATFAAIKIRRQRDSFALMLFACWFFLSQQGPAAAFEKAAGIGAGVSFFEWLIDGLRFRIAFSPVAKRFSTLPGLLLLASLVTLALSYFSR